MLLYAMALGMSMVGSTGIQQIGGASFITVYRKCIDPSKYRVPKEHEGQTLLNVGLIQHLKSYNSKFTRVTTSHSNYYICSPFKEVREQMLNKNKVGE